MAPIFTENCVLQRGGAVKIFGTDQTNSLIKVEILGKNFTAITDPAGQWIATITLPKNLAGGPYKLKVSNQNETIELNKVYVGDVWLASGQSNMERNIDAVENSEFNIKDAENYKGKIFAVRVIGTTRAENLSFKVPYVATWKESNSKNIVNWSAVANAFAKKIYKNQKVPIGIIESIWGNTPIQAWMSKEALNKSTYTNYHQYPQELWFQAVFEIGARNPNRVQAEFTTLYVGKEPYQKFTAWFNDHKLVNTGGLNYHKIPTSHILGRHIIKVRLKADNIDENLIKKLEEELKQTHFDLDGDKIFITDWFHEVSIDPRTETSVFNGIVSPIIPYTIKGVLWYQGENNLAEYKNYPLWFKNMVEDWRQKWKSNLSFIVVQLSSYKAEGSAEYLSLFREAQGEIPTLVPNTYMVTSVDLGNADHNIHSKKKDEVGHRLALVALDKIYKQKNIKSNNPRPRKITPIMGSLKIDFGLDKLICKDTCPKANQLSQDFLVAGADKIYHPAKVSLTDHSILLSSPEVKQPLTVRYAWSDTPTEFIYNEAGLPITPFRNDNW